MHGDESATGWVCTQVWYAFRRGLKQLADSGKSCQAQLGFRRLFFVGNSLRVRFGERKRSGGFCKSWNSQPNIMYEKRTWGNLESVVCCCCCFWDSSRLDLFSNENQHILVTLESKTGISTQASTLNRTHGLYFPILIFQKANSISQSPCSFPLIRKKSA